MIKNIMPALLDGPFQPKKVAEEGLLVGLAVVAKVGFDTYQGNKTNRVKGLTAGTAGGNEFMAG